MTALCACGCGQPAPLAPHSLASKGWVKGQPLKFVHGHNARRDPGYKVTESGCWEWQGGQSGNGYGRASRNGKLHPAHRWYWEQENGPVPAGMQLDHLCRNRICVNPAHLEPVTPAENSQRSSVAKLSRADVKAIRQARIDALAADPVNGKGQTRKRVRGGTELRVRLAMQYGVRADYIKTIWRGDSWAA